MDPLLASYLYSTDQAERQQHLEELLLFYASPVVRQTLRRRLGFYVNQQGRNPHNLDAEDLYQEIMTKIVQTLHELVSPSTKNAIENACRDFGPFTWVAEKITIPLLSKDPNDKVGSTGAGAGRYVSREEPLQYSIDFENLESANAPAQDVVITDQLDTSKLDFDTFSLGPIAFGVDKLVVPPSGLSEFNTDIDLRPLNNLIVRINAKLDKSTGLLTWRFTSLDPATGLPAEDPTAGFLPPNNNAPEGEGQVLFTVQPKQGIATGTEIRNRARIVFDNNPPIDTPEWLNTIDNTKPTSRVLPLPATQCTTGINLRWSGSDEGSGVKDFTILVADGGTTKAYYIEHCRHLDGFSRSNWPHLCLLQCRAGQYTELRRSTCLARCYRQHYCRSATQDRRSSGGNCDHSVGDLILRCVYQ